jgi:hypothetical protein
MKSIYDTLFDAVKIQGFKEQSLIQTDEEYIKSFARAIAALPNDVWNLLPQECHIWYQNTARCINGKRPFENWPKCEGFVSIHIAVPLAETGVVGEPQPATSTPLAPEKKRRLAPKDSKYVGSIKEIRKIIMVHPEWTARTVHKFMEGAGFAGIKFDIVSIVASETRAMMLLAKELGFWREISIYDKTIPPDPTEVEEETEQKTGS